MIKIWYERDITWRREEKNSSYKRWEMAKESWRQQPGEIEWLRYGTRENTHEEEKNSSYKTWEMTKEPWQEEGNNLKKWNDHLKSQMLKRDV